MLNRIAVLIAMAVLLGYSRPASAKPKKEPSKPSSVDSKPSVAVSTKAAGNELPSYAPPTQPLTLESIAAKFAETDAAIVSLKTGFRQFVRLEGSDTVQTVEGDVLFKKPDLIRLTHKIPEPQTVVSDGTWLWVHRESTNQVIKTKLEAWRKSEPLAQGLLDFGKSADLLQRYKAALSTVSAPGADGHRSFILDLKPKEKTKSDADFTLTLKATTKDYFPADATLRVGKASIRSVFEGARLNPELPDETFKFAPPITADLFTTPE